MTLRWLQGDRSKLPPLIATALATLIRTPGLDLWLPLAGVRKGRVEVEFSDGQKHVVEVLP